MQIAKLLSWEIVPLTILTNIVEKVVFPCPCQQVTIQFSEIASGDWEKKPFKRFWRPNFLVIPIHAYFTQTDGGGVYDILYGKSLLQMGWQSSPQSFIAPKAGLCTFNGEIEF